MPLDIINYAREIARVPLIGSMSEPTVDAQASALLYRRALKWLIEQTEWNCLHTTICPNDLPDPDCCNIPQGFRFAFAYPDDAHRINAVLRKECHDKKCECEEYYEPIKWRIARLRGELSAHKAIVSDCKSLIVEYTALPSDCEVQGFTQDMRDAMSYRIAENLFIANGDFQNAEKYRQIADLKLSNARANDAQQGDPQDGLENPGFLVHARCW